MKYTLYAPQPQSHYLQIDLEIKLNTEEEIELCLPAWRPGRYKLGNFAKNIKKFEAVDEKGIALSFKKTDKQTWLIQTKDSSIIKISYGYYASELNAGSTYVDQNQIYVNPVNCLFYIKNRMNEPHEVNLNIPSDYQLACSLPHQQNSLLAADYNCLADSPFIASKSLRQISFTVSGLPVNLHFNGECQLDESKLVKDFTAFMAETIRFFGEHDLSEYHFLFQILPFRFYHGVEHKNNTVITLGPSYLLMNGETYLDLLGVSCHEFFHSWNIKSIRPKEMWPYDYSKENYARTGYIYEGITTYYGDKLLHSSGVYNQQEYFLTLEERINKHLHNFGRYSQSLAEASFDTWLDGYVPGAPDRKISIYDEGCLFAFVLDVSILQKSSNEKSLRDLMQLLYQDYHLNGKGYAEQDILSLVHNLCGESMDHLFYNYLYSRTDYWNIFNDCCSYLGIEATQVPNEKASERFLGLKVIETIGAFPKILTIAPESPASNAGLSINDEIMAVNGFLLKNDLQFWLDYFIKQKSEIKLTINSSFKVKEVVCIVESSTSHYNVIKLNSIPTKNTDNLNKWLYFK